MASRGEHYVEAELALVSAREAIGSQDPMVMSSAMFHMARAQVHATLASCKDNIAVGLDIPIEGITTHARD